MPDMTPFKELHTTYDGLFNSLGWVQQAPTAAIFLTRFCQLYLQNQVKKITPYSENDMLVFQYALQPKDDRTYFYINLTRQLCQDQKIHQLSCHLFFHCSANIQIDSNNLCSGNYSSLTEWVAELQKTSGFLLANQLTPAFFQWSFTGV
ncbi:hypothetical protein VQ643_14335 [Pseudomonas sp. F1_0610]|uniref:hypothetical protein n=1 Tax=Pseudomonas sp. F1_0610 TaxID=3114284 RepID=UPI0039C2F8CD